MDYSQYKVKKKRAVDPNAPPRPNLLSHEKVLKDTKSQIAEIVAAVQDQAHEIRSLRSRINQLEHTINILRSRR
jgi:chromosome segregation ATPase